MTDKELLRRAALASGLKLSPEWDTALFGVMIGAGDGHLEVWNPLDDDGDALRLAVKLRLVPEFSEHGVYVFTHRFEERLASVKCNDDPYAATRRAIVCAAAELGKNL